MAHDLPEPIPTRIPHGYLNDQIAAELFTASFFFKTTCRWCDAVMTKDALGHYRCSGTIEQSSCDAADA